MSCHDATCFADITWFCECWLFSVIWPFTLTAFTFGSCYINLSFQFVFTDGDLTAVTLHLALSTCKIISHLAIFWHLFGHIFWNQEILKLIGRSRGTRFFCFAIQILRNVAALGVHTPPTRSTPPYRKSWIRHWNCMCKLTWQTLLHHIRHNFKLYFTYLKPLLAVWIYLYM